MSKKIIKLTKSKLREIVKECVDKIITESKTIFGFKDESTFEFLKKEITDKVNAFINRTKINESLSNSEEEIEQIWNRFSKNENEIEK